MEKERSKGKANSPKSMKALGEWGFLNTILPRLKNRSRPFVLVPPGDDAAVIKTQKKSALTIDGITENTHFRLSWDRPLRRMGVSLGHGIGWKSLAGALSDLASMGDTQNRWAMIYLAVPGKTSTSFLEEFRKGVMAAAHRFECDVVGGDTVAASQLSVVVAAGGEIKGNIWTRAGARVGDILAVGGMIGESAMAINFLERRAPRAASRGLRSFFYPQPQFDLAAQLRKNGGITSAMDLSDPLDQTVSILARDSNVGFRVELDRIPRPVWLKKISPSQSAFWGGEDFKLLVTGRPRAFEKKPAKKGLVPIGRVVPSKEGITYWWRGRQVHPKKTFTHYK